MLDGFFHPRLDSPVKFKPSGSFPVASSPRLPNARAPPTKALPFTKYKGNRSDGVAACLNARADDIRDQQSRRGLTPRDHARDNMNHVKIVEKLVAALNEAAIAAEVSRIRKTYKPNKQLNSPPPAPPPPPAPEPPWVPPGNYEATSHHVLLS